MPDAIVLLDPPKEITHLGGAQPEYGGTYFKFPTQTEVELMPVNWIKFRAEVVEEY